MQLLPVLAWIAAIYCVGGALVVLAVVLAAKDRAATGDTEHPPRTLMIFAAWPAVLAQMVLVGVHATVQRFRVRP